MHCGHLVLVDPVVDQLLFENVGPSVDPSVDRVYWRRGVLFLPMLLIA